MKLSESLRESLEQATWVYQEAFAGSPAEEYLAGRGISAELAATFRLGYVAEPEVGHDDYIGRLAIPYLTPAGPVDIRFRNVGGDSQGPKYLTRPGATGHLFNVLAFQADTDYIALSEGELDAVVATGLCGLPTVGVPGANAWKPFYHRAFLDYRRVFLLADGDEAGRGWAKRIASEVETATPITMPDGCDVNEFVLAHGPDELRKRCGLV